MTCRPLAPSSHRGVRERNKYYLSGCSGYELQPLVTPEDGQFPAPQLCPLQHRIRLEYHCDCT